MRSNPQTKENDMPFKFKPDDGPQIKPARDSSNDNLYESSDPTCSTELTQARHGNFTGAIKANDLGPGTLSPAAVQALDFLNYRIMILLLE